MNTHHQPADVPLQAALGQQCSQTSCWERREDAPAPRPAIRRLHLPFVAPAVGVADGVPSAKCQAPNKLQGTSKLQKSSNVSFEIWTLELV
jgi:hypothetical protein